MSTDQLLGILHGYRQQAGEMIFENGEAILTLFRSGQPYWMEGSVSSKNTVTSYWAMHEDGKTKDHSTKIGTIRMKNIPGQSRQNVINFLLFLSDDMEEKKAGLMELSSILQGFSDCTIVVDGKSRGRLGDIMASVVMAANTSNQMMDSSL